MLPLPSYNANIRLPFCSNILSALIALMVNYKTLIKQSPSVLHIHIKKVLYSNYFSFTNLNAFFSKPAVLKPLQTLVLVYLSLLSSFSNSSVTEELVPSFIHCLRLENTALFNCIGYLLRNKLCAFEHLENHVVVCFKWKY